MKKQSYLLRNFCFARCPVTVCWLQMAVLAVEVAVERAAGLHFPLPPHLPRLPRRPQGGAADRLRETHPLVP